MCSLRLGQLQLGLTVLCRRLYFAIVLALCIGRELAEPGDGARRLLIRRLELLALGGVLVDLAEYLVPVRDQLLYTTSDLVFHHRSPIWIRRPLNEHESVVVR